nr:KilA-N domain-containing protein [[Ruminococcus] lactaris]
MGKVIKETIHANGIDIGIYTQDFENEFISLTDIARYKSDDPTAVIQNWMRNRDVIEFLGLWERLHNPDFNPLGKNSDARVDGSHLHGTSLIHRFTGITATKQETVSAAVSAVGGLVS